MEVWQLNARSGVALAVLFAEDGVVAIELFGDEGEFLHVLAHPTAVDLLHLPQVSLRLPQTLHFQICSCIFFVTAVFYDFISPLY